MVNCALVNHRTPCPSLLFGKPGSSWMILGFKYFPQRALFLINSNWSPSFLCDLYYSSPPGMCHSSVQQFLQPQDCIKTNHTDYCQLVLRAQQHITRGDWGGDGSGEKMSWASLAWFFYEQLQELARTASPSFSEKVLCGQNYTVFSGIVPCEISA